MTEQMKFIVKEINSTLGRNYDLIKFDSLDEKQLLQLLVDLLVNFKAGDKLDVREDETEMISVRLLEMLGSVKYRPPATVDSSQFRVQLLAGDPRTIHHVMHWLLTNKEQVKKTAYLAKYLKVPDIPPDVIQNNTIQDLLDLYQNLMDEFKEVHKRTRLLEKENATEIINDIKEMAVERDIVIKRLENVQVHLVDVNNKEELLSYSKALRLQQERAKELENQYEMQQSQLKLSSDQLKRYLNVIHGQSATPKSVNDVIKRLQEEIQLNSYLVKEKLPQESAQLQKELNIMQTVAMEQHPTRSDIVGVQDKLSAVNSEVEQMVQRRLAAAGPQDDKLAPFRQQAAVIRRNKEASADRVNDLTATLKEHEAVLADLQSQVKQLLGDMVLRGEELKKYVSSLRTKSSLYKRQRANLATFKVEAGILSRTLHILNTADPTIEMALVNHKKMKIDEDDLIEKDKNKPSEIAKKSLHDLSQIVAQTAQKLSEMRQEIQPLAEKIKPIKDEYQTVQQQYEQKKRIYEATSINITSQMEPLKSQVKELTDKLNSKELEWKNLRQKITKAESLQEDVMFEMKNAMQSPRKPSKMETLKKRVKDLEEIVKNLEEEQREISSRQGEVEEQSRLWEGTLRLLRCKLQARAHSAAHGKMHITQHSQMLTLN
ncbi:PREDICTED: intraflagellar transport protein 81 homolog [Papilio polytes]|uniref:intraflagellar transport protein 81 homolog n=1 Tax=Papilio polytes TaxID=76194 RepID=UPI0006769A11|nr:PREDICTED: intraflagellar transport protein 81 homolog [Papilio polytes]